MLLVWAAFSIRCCGTGIPSICDICWKSIFQGVVNPPLQAFEVALHLHCISCGEI
jgi:hypothetical protein